MTATLRKVLVIPLALVGLGVAFGVVCVLLAIFKGNDSILRKKLAIGALILTLSGFTSQGVVYASCYVAEEPIDADMDGLATELEVSLFGTDAYLEDSNADGVVDGLEDHDGDGFTNAEEHADLLALSAAARDGDIDEVRRQIERGTPLDVCHPEAFATPLGTAAGLGQIEVMKALIDAGADTEARGPGGRTALSDAVSTTSEQVLLAVELLIDSGAEVNPTDTQWTPLMSIASDNADIVRALLSAGADPTYSAMNRTQSPLSWASYRGHTAVATELIAAGADVNRSLYAGTTALMMAANGGHVGVVTLLLTSGVQVDAVTENGRSALMQAVGLPRRYMAAEPPGDYDDHVSVVQLLLDAGADFSMEDKDGATALDLAIEFEHTDIVELLRVAGAIGGESEIESRPDLHAESTAKP